MKRFNLPTLDASQNVFFQRQLELIEPTLHEIQYAERKARKLVPTTPVPDGIESVTRTSVDRTGTAKRIANAADDLPQVNVFATQESAKMWDYGAAFGYTEAEIRAAAKGGMPLDAMRARAAREALADKLDEICAVGDSDIGNEGLLNLTGANDVTSDLAGDEGDWDAADADEILAALNKAVMKSAAVSRDIEKCTHLILPSKLHRKLSRMPRQAVSDTTVLKFFMDTNPGLVIDTWERSNDSEATNEHRVVAYEPNPVKLRLLMSVEAEQQAPQLRNYSYIVNMRMRCGGVLLHYPKSLSYMDIVYAGT